MFKDGRFQRVDLWKPSKLKEGKTHSTQHKAMLHGMHKLLPKPSSF